MSEKLNNGALCISLDFEKYWGLHDLQDIRENVNDLAKVSAIVQRLLDMFQKYDIHCTWATVGLLNFDQLSTLQQEHSDLNIPYQNQRYSPFPIEKHQLDSVESNLFLGQDDIQKIKTADHQELASHTFSHYYCLEKGQTLSDFKKDLDNFENAINQKVLSIVFPRNQVKKEYLKLCYEYGVRTYRGNQENHFWKNSDFESESIFKKIGRTADAYLKLTSDNFVNWKDLQTESGLINIPASRFLKPYHFPKMVEQLKIKRIKAQMTRAAKSKKIFHLWWHPHNFSKHTDHNFKQLEIILNHFKSLQNDYQFESLNMSEIYQQIV